MLIKVSHLEFKVYERRLIENRDKPEAGCLMKTRWGVKSRKIKKAERGYKVIERMRANYIDIERRQ